MRGAEQPGAVSETHCAKMIDDIIYLSRVSWIDGLANGFQIPRSPALLQFHKKEVRLVRLSHSLVPGSRRAVSVCASSATGEHVVYEDEEISSNFQPRNDVSCTPPVRSRLY